VTRRRRRPEPACTCFNPHARGERDGKVQVVDEAGRDVSIHTLAGSVTLGL